MGRAIQAAGAFAAILNSLAMIVDNFESLSKFVAGVDRLDTFVNFLRSETAERSNPRIVIESVPGSALAFEHVTLQTPDQKRSLVMDLSVAISPARG